MKKNFIVTGAIIFLTIFVPVFLSAEDTPSDFYLSALVFSRAPWGANQSLTIDSTGAVEYYVIETNAGATDSIFTSLDAAGMQMIYDTVTQVNFFTLDTLYEGDFADGQGVRLLIQADPDIHLVEANNYAVSEINRIVLTLNYLLNPSGIELIYGALIDTTLGWGGK